MKSLTKKFENFGLEHGFLKPNARIVIGLSGGADSIALTLLLMEFQVKYSLFLMAAHVNYHLRGEESNLDEKFVKEFCFKNNILLYILQGKPQVEVGIQKAARDIRLKYFKDLKRHYKLDYIALGHHSDDQAETVLLMILRGAGFTGLGGIAPIKGEIIHPILLFKKEELINYLNYKGVGFRVDQTNFSNKYTRNKIRNDFIPFIKKEFNPNIEKRLLEYGNLFYLTEKYFDNQAQKEYKKALISANHSDIVFDVIKLRKIYPIIRFYLFRMAFTELRVTSYKLQVTREKLQEKSPPPIHPNNVAGVSSHIYGGGRVGETDFQENKDFYSYHFQDIMGILESDSGFKEVVLPENIVVLKDYNTLIFRNLDRYQEPEKELEKEISTIRNIFAFNGYRIEMKKVKQLGSSEFGVRSSEFRTQYAVFDFDKIVFPIKLRYRKAGDRFIPFGMNSFKKLKNFLIDEKVPLKERDNIVLFTDAEKIIWVSGYRIDQRVAVSNETKNFLCVKIDRCDDLKNRAAVRVKI